MSDESVFAEAVAIPDPADRAAFLDQACAGNPALRREVEELLAAHDRAGTFLEPPPSPTATAPPDSPDGTAEYPPGGEVGAVIAGRYTLLERIGEGGMGEVWVAKQTEPVTRKVAVKLIKAGMDSRTVVARFEAERQALALMDHPNIARVLDGGLTDRGRPFFVMELVNGLPLTKFCDEAKLTPRERLELFVPVCQAVQHAHQKGIVHRDLKPSNILVTLYDGRPVPKVIDFGVAKATGGKLSEHTVSTGFGAVVGTLEYMAPEQAGLSALDVDTRADLYSLGVVLYELLTGLRPFDSTRLKKAAFDEVLRIIREEEPPRPSTRLSTDDSLPSLAAVRQTDPKRLTALMRGELDWLVMRCLEKERGRRYETANALSRDVQRYLADEPVEARPPSKGYRARKFLQRNRGPALAAALVLLALVAGVVGTTVGLIRADRQRQLAEEARQGEADRAEAEAEQRRRAEAAETLAKTRLGEVTKQKERADEEAAIARAVNEFTQSDILGQASSAMQADRRFVPDPDLKVRTALDRAAAKVGTAFTKQPKVEAAIRETIGNAYRGVGEYDKAIEHLKRSVDLCRSELGPDDPDTLASMGNLAEGYREAGKLDLALPLYEETLKHTKARLGPDDPDTLASMNNLALGYLEAGKLDLALPLFKETLRLIKAKLGPDHPHTLRSMNNLAGGYGRTGKLDLALPLFKETLKLRKAKLGPDHPHTLKSMNNLASGYRDAGKLDLALPLLEETLKLRKAKLWPDHPDTLRGMNSLAAAYWSAKQLDKSIPLFEQALAARRKCLGERHPDTLVTMANLGVNYRDAGRLTEAIPLLEQAYRGGRGHASLNWVGGALLEAYIRAGKTTEGAALAKSLLAETHKALPAGSVPLAGALAVNGLALLQLKAWSEAELVLRECLAIREKKQPDAWNTFNTRSSLGGALLGQKKYPEAEPLLLTGYEEMKQREVKIPPAGKVRLSEAADRLVELYTRWSKPAEAARWRAERAKYPPEQAPLPRPVVR